MSASDPGFCAALAEARQGLTEGGVPIGSSIVGPDGKVWGSGRNMRVQLNSPILHAEISAFNNALRQSPGFYRQCTVYTTLSPCHMCTGACLLYKVKRVVIGENWTFMGAERLLREHGVEVIVLDNQECKDLMSAFIQSDVGKQVWNEDIGVEENDSQPAPAANREMDWMAYLPKSDSEITSDHVNFKIP